MAQFSVITGGSELGDYTHAWIFCERYLEEFAYRIELTPWPFITATLLAMFISLVSVLWQIIRAAKTNPAGALKKE